MEEETEGMRRKGARRRAWREKEGTRTRRKRSSTIEAQPKSQKGTQEELGWRTHKIPKRPQQKRAKESTNGRLRHRPKTRKRERNRVTSKEDTSNMSLKVSNPTIGRQREQKEDLPGKDTKRERDQGQGIRGRTPKQRKHMRQIPGRKTTRRKRTPHTKEARRPWRTRRKREKGGRSKQRHLAESGTKQPNRNKERQRDAQVQQERNKPQNRGTRRQETMASTPRPRD